MNSTSLNIQPLQGCDIWFRVDRGFSPTVIRIVPLRGTIFIKIKRIKNNLPFPFAFSFSCSLLPFAFRLLSFYFCLLSFIFCPLPFALCPLPLTINH
jgi:hypothetical protein